MLYCGILTFIILVIDVHCKRSDYTRAGYYDGRYFTGTELTRRYDPCATYQFKCQTRDQRINRCYQCDGHTDCLDGSDEIGCFPPTVTQKPEPHVSVCGNETLVLKCCAVGGPVPVINWRLNWGCVCTPPRCTQKSADGCGTLTIRNFKSVDEGVYSCEAVNIKGRVYANPDAIVSIQKNCGPSPAPCDPRGTRLESIGECGCKPLVIGPYCNQCPVNTFHLDAQNPHGCLTCECMGITKQCDSSSYYRTQERLVFDYDDQGVLTTDSKDIQMEIINYDYNLNPGQITTDFRSQFRTLYWKMPKKLLGNKITAYGGHLKFPFQFSGSGAPNQDPLVILKGNGITLVLHNRDRFEPYGENNIDIHMTETFWDRHEGGAATRSDLLICLADLETFLIRQTHCDDQSSSSLGQISMDVAVPMYTQQGLALAVEQCACPIGYVGTSCEDCAAGYVRVPGGGGHIGICEQEKNVHKGDCDKGGSLYVAVDPIDRHCICKENVQGHKCDECKNHTFSKDNWPDEKNPDGCVRCFCSGVSRDCHSAQYYRTQEVLNIEPGVENDIAIRTSESEGYFTSRSRASIDGRGQLVINDFTDEAGGRPLYIELPKQFLGNKITSYSGILKIVFRYSGSGRPGQDSVVIIRGNEITLNYRTREEIPTDKDVTLNIPFYENYWTREDGHQSTSEHLRMALIGLNSILIKISHRDGNSNSFTLSKLSMEYALDRPTGGERIWAVEFCQCPIGYKGTSCEECDTGYTRTGGGLYLGLCEPCQCHNHSRTCDPETGVCSDCENYTEGDHCERCVPPIDGDATIGTPCDCDKSCPKPCEKCLCNNHSPGGCDSDCNCLTCENNTEGKNCERCKEGFYGDASNGTSDDCLPCNCPENSPCFLDAQGLKVCERCPLGTDPPLCDKCSSGYMPDPDVSGRCMPNVTLPPEKTFKVNIDEPKSVDVEFGSTVRWQCEVSGYPNANLEWSRVDDQPMPQYSSVVSNGIRFLTLYNVTSEHSGQYECRGLFEDHDDKDVASLNVKAQPFAVKIHEPKFVEPTIGSTVIFICEAIGASNALSWSRSDQETLDDRHTDQNGTLEIRDIKQSDSGKYICTGINSQGQQAMDTATVKVKSDPFRVIVEPKNQEVKEGDTVRFTCISEGDPKAQLSWTGPHGLLPQEGSSITNGVITLQNVRVDDAGQYQCTGYSDQQQNATDEGHLDVKSVPLKVRIREPKNPQVRLGGTIQFICEVDGTTNKPVVFEWTRPDGKSLPTEHEEQNGVLTLNNLKIEDEGSYKCIGSTAGEQDSDNAHLTIEGGEAPETKITPKNVMVKQGSPVAFMCTSTGNPPPLIIWGYGAPGDPLRAGISQSNGRLFISSALLSDAGKYYCTASNPLGTSSDDSVLTVEEPFESPVVQINPSNAHINLGEDVRFICTAEGAPLPSLIWSRKNGSNLGENVKDDGAGILQFTNSTYDSIGDYICTASNQVGVDSATVNLKVGNPEAPRVKIDPPNAHVNPDEDAQFTCTAEGVPSPSVVWSRQNGSLGENVEVRGNGVLQFTKCTFDNIGDYVCTASNIIGANSATANLKVGTGLAGYISTVNPGKQKIIVAPNGIVEIKSDIPTALSCEAYAAPGMPIPTVEWVYYTKPLGGDVPEGYERPVSKGENVTIGHPTQGNEGLYNCVITSGDEQLVLTANVKYVASSRVKRNLPLVLSKMKAV